MWPFKKRKSSEEESHIVFNTIICIPGNWENWDEFIIRIVDSSGGKYIAAGNILYDVEKKLTLYLRTFSHVCCLLHRR